MPAVVSAQTNDVESLGFSSARLAYIRPWYQAQIDAEGLTGAVVAIARNGKIAYLEAVGTQDREKRIAMATDAIFWIASMTKPVTSVAAMVLVDEGKLDLTAPVYLYLPDLKDMQVGVEKVDAATGEKQAHRLDVKMSGLTGLGLLDAATEMTELLGTLVLEPPKRPMTVRDLLQHTSGLVYPHEGNTAIHKLYNRAVFRRDTTLAEFVASLAKLPLAHQPGEVWEYSWGVDVLARVVEVASGQPFDQFLESRIFTPLGMVDTGFYVPQAKLSRLVDSPSSGRLPLWDVAKPSKLFSGGGGLVSTAHDYMRFCQMLLNGGELDGVRILTPQTVQQMTTASLPRDTPFAGIVGEFMGPRWGTGWGLGFAVRTDPSSPMPGRIGSFAWGGVWGTRFWIDPAEKLAVVQMIQVEPADDNGRYGRALQNLTYEALRVTP